MRRPCLLVLGLALAATMAALPARAHDVRLPVAADALQILSTGAGAPSIRFEFTEQQPILLNHDPTQEITAVLVYGTGAQGGSTGLLTLDPSLWTSTNDGYSYADPQGGAGISSIVLEQGTLTIEGDPATWPWSPGGPVDELWFHFLLEEEWFCAVASGATATEIDNEAGRVHFADTTAPFSCPEQVCGNAIREPGELCDDGNLEDGDGCSPDCQSDQCEVPEFSSTFEGIQQIIFDSELYGCTNAACHSGEFITPKANLDLREGLSYDNLVNVASEIPSASAPGVIFDRVEPGEPSQSFLYEKLAAKTLGTPTNGTPMPNTRPGLTAQHLQAVERWIRAGAPRDLVVEQTAGLLGTCLPPEDPLKLDPPPDPPTAGEGIQFRSTAWPLPANFEDEVCYATYYDFTQTSLVPEEDQFDCPPGSGGPFNPSGKCFYWNRRVERQDAQSHHSIIHIYLGSQTDGILEDFGPFTRKPNFIDPTTGTACDPFEIDPATGTNNDCSGAVIPGVACSGYGPADFQFTSPSFAGSQEPFIESEYYDGVYGFLPMSGVVVWNSHAFNLSDGDSTMAHYVDMFFGEPDSREYPARGIFDIRKIFIQKVPPGETREYCKTYTVRGEGAIDYNPFNPALQPNAQLTELTSHTHRWGTQFRIWGPPQIPCNPDPDDPFDAQFSCEPNCECGPGDPEDLIYFSTQYTDPVQLEFDPPLSLGPGVADRTFLYCSVYDNGSTPESPPLKRQSTSPEPPYFEQYIGALDATVAIPIGGPCPDVEGPFPESGLLQGLFGTVPGVMCVAGPNQGVACGEEADPATFCETAPGAGDGECDACAVMGGFTTEDEMYILIGTYFIPEPAGWTLGLAALVALGGLARRRRGAADDAAGR